MALERAALAVTQFVDGVAFANPSAKDRVLATAQPAFVGPKVNIGENATAQVVVYPARVQATFEGRPIFAEKIEPVIGLEVRRQVRRDGTKVDIADRYPFRPGLQNVPEEIVTSLAEGISNRVI